MTVKSFPLDLIQVASPCHVAWDEMRGDDRVRHCGQCHLNVYNLSEMPRDEAERFLSERTGRTCVRFFRRYDGTVLTRDCPVGLWALRQRLWRGVAAASGLFVALLSGTVFASFVSRLLPASLQIASPLATSITPEQPVVGIMVMGDICLPPPPIAVPPIVTTVIEPAESPLPEPTPEQLQDIAERLQ